MDYNEAMQTLSTLSMKEGAWISTGLFKRNSDNTFYPIVLDNVIFDEENCICIYRLGGYPVFLHIKPKTDGKLNFGILCSEPVLEENNWYSSSNLKECFAFVREWFSKK